ncbi:MAG: heavy metal-binding domain-containing protein, partial [Alteromonadaceae bacterium]
MIYSTTETIPGREITEIVGVVTGNVVQAKHIGRDIMAGLKNIVGGEIRGYTEMLTDAREIAIERLVLNAQELG